MNKIRIEKGSFVSDYTVDFTDLSKLYDITQTKMRGAIKLAGNIKQSNVLKIVLKKKN